MSSGIPQNRSSSSPSTSTSPENPEEKKESGNALYWIAGGATAAVLWYLGIPQTVIEKVTEVAKHITPLNAAQAAAPIANAATIASVSSAIPSAEKTPDVFEEALKKSSDKGTPTLKPDKFDKLLSGISADAIAKSRQPIAGTHSLHVGDRSVPVKVTDSSNPFTTLSEVSSQLFSKENLQNAARAVTEAQVGKPFDVNFYKPQIQRLCKDDPYKYEPLLAKLDQLEKAQSSIETAKENLKSQTVSAAVGGAAGVIGSYITVLCDKMSLDPKGDKAKQEALDREFMKVIEDENCDHIVDAKTFQKIAGEVFERHPVFAMANQAKYERCLVKVKKAAV